MPRNNNVKTKALVLYIMLFIIVVGGLYLFYLDQIDGVYVNKILSVAPDEVTTDKTTYKPGEYIQVSWKVCKDRPLSALVNFSFINEVVVAIPEIKRNLPVGCYLDKPIFQVKIPECIHAGDFVLKGQVSYELNSLHTIVYNLESNSFIIEK
jgi:hypothetical protein